MAELDSNKNLVGIQQLNKLAQAINSRHKNDLNILYDYIDGERNDLNTINKTVIGAINELELESFETKANIIALDTYKADKEYVDNLIGDNKLGYLSFVPFKEITEEDIISYNCEPYSEDATIHKIYINSRINMIPDQKYKFILTHDDGSVDEAVGDSVDPNISGFEGACYLEAYSTDCLITIMDGLGFPNDVVDFSIDYIDYISADRTVIQCICHHETTIANIQIENEGTIDVTTEFLETHRFITEEERENWNKKAEVLEYKNYEKSIKKAALTRQGKNADVGGDMMIRYNTEIFDVSVNNNYRVILRTANDELIFDASINKASINEQPFHNIVMRNFISGNIPLSSVIIRVGVQVTNDAKYVISNSTNVDIYYPNTLGEIQFTEIEIIESSLELIEHNEFYNTHRFVTEEEKESWNKKTNEDKLITDTISGNVLTLTTDKRQKVEMVDGTEIVLPSVTDFTEIHLYFSTLTDLTLIFPAGKYQKTPEIKANKTYEFIFTYVGEWLIGYIEYGN